MTVLSSVKSWGDPWTMLNIGLLLGGRSLDVGQSGVVGCQSQEMDDSQEPGLETIVASKPIHIVSILFIGQLNLKLNGVPVL
jgi:hypothetical protein